MARPHRLSVVEILHIDTAGSRSFYKETKASPLEKSECQRLLRDQFVESCKRYGGVLRNWAGDGGFAFFTSAKDVGGSVAAAEHFLRYLPVLNAQTALQLEAPAIQRHVRIKGHRGEILIDTDPGLDSADPGDFDDFVKYEKQFAPKDDEFFATEALYEKLPVATKNKFEMYRRSRIRAGTIFTRLYRLKKVPVPSATDIFEHGDQLSEISQSEWNYLRTQIRSHRMNVAARNFITKGLITAVREEQRSAGGICENQLLRLTGLDPIWWTPPLRKMGVER
jgi:hypothetical protein